MNWRTDLEMPIRECVIQCEAGAFGALEDGECLPCHSSCATCVNSPTHCLSCIDGYEYDGDDYNCKNAQGCRDDQFTNGKSCSRISLMS